MSYSIEVSDNFEKLLKRLSKKFPSLKKEYADLIDLLKENPFQGTSIGNSCYKIRLSIASKGKGKSSGARIITHVYVCDKTIYLLSIYDKSEQESISYQEIKEIIKSTGL